jgi:hypothetical protein
MLLGARKTVDPDQRFRWCVQNLAGVHFEHPQFGEMCINWTTLKNMSYNHLGVFVYAPVSESRRYCVFGQAIQPNPTSTAGNCTVCTGGTSLLTNGGGTRYTFLPLLWGRGALRGQLALLCESHARTQGDGRVHKGDQRGKLLLVLLCIIASQSQ